MGLRTSIRLATFLGLVSLISGYAIPRDADKPPKDAKVLILGGGVAGIIAARTLAEHNITDFVIIEARDELGGRLKSATFGTQQLHVEAGANWVQGTQEGDGPENPILGLVKKHNVKTQFNDYVGSMTTYDYTGQVDYLDIFNKGLDDYAAITSSAGPRVNKSLVDTTARTGYSLVGEKPKTPQEKAAEYYAFDWEYAQTPEQTSWIASSWANNFTFDSGHGGFSEENLMSIDQRGFKTFIQEEAKEFLTPKQVLLNKTVVTITYSASGVKVTLSDGQTISGDYALCTFSLGVLQHDDVKFEPALPDWKMEAIHSMTMATYTKIFLQFPEKFWFDTELAVYADVERGRYPVWQSLDHKNFFPGSGILFATVTGDFSERIEAMEDDVVKSEVMSVVSAMFPGRDIPDPLDFFFPRWGSDPLYRGSYSNWPSSFVSEHHDNLRATVDGRLWFSGEATSQKWFGFLHGAYFEGLDVGKEMAKCIQGGGCVGLQHMNEVRNANKYKI